MAAHGKKWSEIAKMMPRRLGKRIRERYINHLDPRCVWLARALFLVSRCSRLTNKKNLLYPRFEEILKTKGRDLRDMLVCVCGLRKSLSEEKSAESCRVSKASKPKQDYKFASPLTGGSPRHRYANHHKPSHNKLFLSRKEGGGASAVCVRGESRLV